MKLIIGLGNPGREYEKTRHNVGFMFLEHYISKKKLDIYNWQKKFNSLYLQSEINGEKVIFLKPQTYMNLSGEAVRNFVNFFKIDVNDILVISDDLDLLVGNFKLKLNGSSGGHNGLKNIELHLSTKDYKRIKVGISNDKNMDTKDYVLGKFTKDEIDLINPIIDKIPNIIEDYLKLPFDNVMNKYN